MRRIFRSAIFPLIVIVALVFFAETVLHNHQGKSQQLVYSQLLNEVHSNPGSIKQITADEGKHKYIVENTDGSTATVAFPPSDAALNTDLKAFQKAEIQVKTKGPGGASILGVIINLL